MRCLGIDACNSRCIMACPERAIELGPKSVKPGTDEELQLIHVKRDLCTDCGLCTEKCYPEALYICGKDYTVDEIVTRLLQDRRFYEKSGGGVTISGGEALCQIDFVVEVLKRLKAEGIHTALDTTGYADWSVVERTVPYVDLYLYDIKHMDSAKHKAATAFRTRDPRQRAPSRRRRQEAPDPHPAFLCSTTRAEHPRDREFCSPSRRETVSSTCPTTTSARRIPRSKRQARRGGDAASDEYIQHSRRSWRATVCP
jgi:pyruvate-formate lyase-activating enzyme